MVKQQKGPRQQLMKTKQHYRKIPASILHRIEQLNTDEIVAACVRPVTAQELADGRFRHLGLSLEQGLPRIQEPHLLPSPHQGRYSRFNLEGREIVRRDLPKISKSYTWEVPNWGGHGYHDITVSREVYQREFEAPRESTMAVEKLSENEPAGGPYLFRFTVEEVLNRKDADLDARLLTVLNLLQENVGAINVFARTASLADYTQNLQVDWELLPPGMRGEVLAARIASGSRSHREQIQIRIEARRKFLEGFKPTNWLVGTSGFRRYFGAKFSDELVVFENVDYGNAVYVMFSDWESLSKLSRIELQEQSDRFVRIVHRGDWEQRLRRLLMEKLPPPQQQLAV